VNGCLRMLTGQVVIFTLNKTPKFFIILLLQ